MKRLVLLLVCIMGLTFTTYASTGSPVAKKATLATSTIIAGSVMALSRRKNGDLSELEAEALDNLSNFDGYEGALGGYSGYKDDFLSFDGVAQSFANEVAANRIFTVTVTNSASTASAFYIIPGFKNYNADGTVADGVMKEGNFKAIGASAAETSSTGSPATIDQFRRFVERNPTRVVGMKMTASSASVISDMLIVKEEQSPFRELGTSTIYSTLYQNENTYNDKVVTIKEGFDLNDQIAIKVNMPASSSVTFNFICGAILNPAEALKAKHGRFMDTAHRGRRRAPQG